MKIKQLATWSIAITIGCFGIIQSANADQTTFNLSMDSVKVKPQDFYCTAKKIGPGNDTIRITNWAQMITGFDKHGILIIPAKKLNQVYFQAYHDPDVNYKNADGNIIISSPNHSITCEIGKGENRELMSGNFG